MKLLNTALFSTLLFILAACGGSSSEPDNNNQNNGDGGTSTSSSSSTGTSSSSTSSTSSSSGTVNQVELYKPGKRIVSESFSMDDVVDIEGAEFSSSDEEIATVNEVGAVTVLKPGAVTITVTDAQQQTEMLDIESIDPALTVNAWVGEHDTEVTFSSGTEGIEFIRSRNANCDITDLASCNSGQYDTVANTSIIDTAANLSNAGHYVFNYGRNLSTSSILGSYTYADRFSTSTVVFNNKLWVVGGQGGNDDFSFRGDVWSSSNGDTWVKVTDNATFGVRNDHSMIEYKGKLWLIGGENDEDGQYSNVSQNDVWSTVDGETWTEVTAAAPFAPRRNPGVFVFQDKLWVMGGTLENFSQAQDVWYTEDGANWTEADINIYPSAYDPSQFVEFNGKLWLLCEYVPPNEDRQWQVWSTEDGITWEMEVEEQVFGYYPRMHVFNVDETLWAFGYSNWEDLGYLWKSTDGVIWEKVAGGNYLGNFDIFNGTMHRLHDEFYMIGGNATVFIGRNDTWSSPDGLNWRQRGEGGLFAARAGAGILQHNDKLWSIGGRDNSDYHDDVWSSDNGLSWTVQTADVPFSTRAGQAALSFNNRIWVIGGKGSAGGIVSTNSDGDTITQLIILRSYNSVWSSADGLTWTKSEDIPFSARETTSAIVFDGKMWVVSGGAPVDGVIPSDVWYSEDGETWEQATANAAFAGRQGHALSIFNNRIYLSGGADAEEYLMQDVWSSADGVTWQQEVAEAEWVNRAYHQMIEHDGKLWIFAGQMYNYDTTINFEPTVVEGNDIWNSSDGITWTQILDEAPFEERRDHRVMVINDKFYLFGGRGRNGGFDGSVSNQLIDIVFEYYAEVWSSADGINWRQGFAQDLMLKTIPGE